MLCIPPLYIYITGVVRMTAERQRATRKERSVKIGHAKIINWVFRSKHDTADQKIPHLQQFEQDINMVLDYSFQDHIAAMRSMLYIHPLNIYVMSVATMSIERLISTNTCKERSVKIGLGKIINWWPKFKHIFHCKFSLNKIEI